MSRSHERGDYVEPLPLSAKLASELHDITGGKTLYITLGRELIPLFLNRTPALIS